MTAPYPVDVTGAISEVEINVPVQFIGLWRMRLGLWVAMLGFRIMGTVCTVGSIEQVEVEPEPAQ